MLKYFKRERSRRSHDDDTTNNSNGDSNATSVKRNSLRSTSSFCDEVFFDEDRMSVVSDAEGSCCGASVNGGMWCAGDYEDIFQTQSRLSMSMPGIVNDQTCLSYFVQYLETKNALPLIKFYLDTQNFKCAALTQLDIEHKSLAASEQLEQEDVAKNPEVSTTEIATKLNDTHDNEHNTKNKNNVPELKTICDLSMRKPLTDDEKSKIYAETTKQITKCKANKWQNEEPQPSSCISTASIQDAMAIYQKYLIVNAPQFVALPLAILSQISLLLCKRTDAVEKNDDDDDDAGAACCALSISANCFDDAQQYMLQQLENDFLAEFLQSTYYCKYCIELIEQQSGSIDDAQLNIYDILYSEVALFYFMEFLEQQQERSCLDFWTTALNFRKIYLHIENDTQAQDDAMIIYEKYFSLQADCRLWLSDRLRSKVEEAICDMRHVGSCFDLPLMVTAKYLTQKYLNSFLHSQLFENYVNELKLKINEESAEGTSAVLCNLSTDKKLKRHRKTLSDCTNESTRPLRKNISQHNTLLAMESHTQLKLQAAATTTNLNIDSMQLTNPHMLWRRSSSSETGLKFGRINALGRYERDFDVVDSANTATHAHNKHNWSLAVGGNKLKNAMRKLVNLPEDKVQEEIAWQVAEMIVKDVTSITLHDGK